MKGLRLVPGRGGGGTDGQLQLFSALHGQEV